MSFLSARYGTPSCQETYCKYHDQDGNSCK